MCCQDILLKSTGRSNEEISSILGCTAASVYDLQKRFEAGGVLGLKTKIVQHRKPSLTASDETSVRKAIENDRQSLRVAKANWEAATDRTVSESTLRVFPKPKLKIISQIYITASFIGSIGISKCDFQRTEDAVHTISRTDSIQLLAS